MEEQLVSFEIAQLAFEKYFNCVKANVHGLAYNKEGKLLKSGTELIQTLAPTQSLVQKWLREKHNIYTNVQPVIYTGDEIASYYQPTINGCNIGKLRYETWENALEESLQEALKSIKI